MMCFGGSSCQGEVHVKGLPWRRRWPPATPRWRGFLERYLAAVRGELSRYRGHKGHTAGDVFFATFERPADGLACAWAIRTAVRQLGLETRTGLPGRVRDARGAAQRPRRAHRRPRHGRPPGEGEILVLDDMREALEEADLTLVDRGRHELRGVPGEWQLYAAEPEGAG
jgi:class 3 adenylate cyclase